MAKLSRAEKITHAKKELDALITPKVLEDAKNLQKQMVKVTVSDMFKPFTM